MVDGAPCGEPQAGDVSLSDLWSSLARSQRAYADRARRGLTPASPRPHSLRTQGPRRRAVGLAGRVVAHPTAPPIAMAATAGARVAQLAQFSQSAPAESQVVLADRRSRRSPIGKDARSVACWPIDDRIRSAIGTRATEDAVSRSACGSAAPDVDVFGVNADDHTLFAGLAERVAVLAEVLLGHRVDVLVGPIMCALGDAAANR